MSHSAAPVHTSAGCVILSYRKNY